MSLTIAAATLPVMEQVAEAGTGDHESRGRAIGRRMRALGMNYTSLGKEARGMYRQTVRRAIDDDPKVEPATYEILEATLDRLETQLGYAGGPDVVVSTGERLIEFQVSSDSGLRVVVKGPVADADVLRESVQSILDSLSVNKRPPDEQ